MYGATGYNTFLCISTCRGICSNLYTSFVPSGKTLSMSLSQAVIMGIQGGSMVIYGCMSGKAPPFRWDSWVFREIEVQAKSSETAHTCRDMYTWSSPQTSLR